MADTPHVPHLATNEAPMATADAEDRFREFQAKHRKLLEEYHVVQDVVLPESPRIMYTLLNDEEWAAHLEKVAAAEQGAPPAPILP